MDDIIENQDEQETKSRKPPGYWNDYDRVYNEALKYHSRGEFSDKSPTAWLHAKKNGWINKYSWLQRKRIKRGFWQNRENCYNTAKEIKTMTELIDNYPGLYKSAKENGWLSEYTWLKRRSSKNLSTEDIPNSEE